MRTAALIFILCVCLWLPEKRPASAQAQDLCGYSPLVAEMLNQFRDSQWSSWILQLSGEMPIQIGGETTRILSRHTQRMFIGDPTARAFEYVSGVLKGILGDRARYEMDPFLVYKPPEEVFNGQNLIIDLPGASRPEEIVVLSAHLDSLSDRPQHDAPGADDNGTGIATVLEAARIFSQYRFERTVRLILFTGEEQHEVGSRAYLADHPPKGVVAVVNIDMVGADADNDHCIELHAGPLPASWPVAQCIQSAIQAYGLDLKTEVLTVGATIESDQSSYWAYGIGAVMLWENATPPLGEAVCKGTDLNPYYHTTGDRFEIINQATALAASRAAIAATASLAGPLERCRGAVCEPGGNSSARNAEPTLWRRFPHYVAMQ